MTITSGALVALSRTRNVLDVMPRGHEIVKKIPDALSAR